MRTFAAFLIALLLAACGSKNEGLRAVVLVDPGLGGESQTRAAEAVKRLLAEAARLGAPSITVAAATTGGFTGNAPPGWLEEWRTTAVTLLPKHEATLLVVYLAESRPVGNTMPFDNILVVRERAQPNVGELVAAWGVPPTEKPDSPAAKEWLAAMKEFPLAGGLTQWSKEKSDALAAAAGKVAKPFVRDRSFPLALAGRALLAAAKPADAAELFHRAGELQPDAIRHKIDEGIALRNAKQGEKALALTQPLLAQHPGDADLISEVALEHAQLGRPLDAEKLLRAGLEKLPNSALLHTNLGGLLSDQMGRKSEANALLEKAVELDPNHPVAKTNWQAIQALDRALDTEIGRLREVVARSPKEAVEWRSLGIALARRGDLAGSADALRRARALLPADAETQKVLAAVEKIQAKSSVR